MAGLGSRASYTLRRLRGQALLRDDIVDLIAHAYDIGLITCMPYRS